MPLIEHAVAEAQARGENRVGASLMVEGARAWCFANELARCEQLLSAARSELTAMLPAGHTAFGALETAFAELALARSDPLHASATLERAVAIYETASEKNPTVIRALTLLARTELQLGERDAAQAHAERAIAQARNAMAGFEHSEWLGSALVAQGMVQHARGEIAAAQATWRAALVELQASVGDSALITTEVHRLLAGI
jgi:tetratricopeptide (TPR) repeat protein